MAPSTAATSSVEVVVSTTGVEKIGAEAWCVQAGLQ